VGRKAQESRLDANLKVVAPQYTDIEPTIPTPKVASEDINTRFFQHDTIHPESLLEWCNNSEHGDQATISGSIARLNDSI
jgi:hypothetical protein